MKQQLFNVSAKNKKSGESIDLMVWAENVDEATRNVSSIFFGQYGEYIWRGSGPVYENNKIVVREITALL